MNLPPDVEAKIVHAENCRCPMCRRKAAWEGMAPDPDNEKAFMAEVIALAKRNGWDCYHTHDSRKSAGGYPDLTMWRERVIFAELKTNSGRTTAAQDTVLEGLRGAGAEVFLWRPAMWVEIVAVLTSIRSVPLLADGN